MLRWKLQVTGPADSALHGARRIVTSMADSPLRPLLERAPPLDDTARAARIAVLWALAEQHYRYAPTENPLTLVANGTEEDVLACVPDEVAADVAAVLDGPGVGLVAELEQLGPVTAGLAFKYPGGADLDLLCGTALVEVKTTVSSLGLVDVLEFPLCYSLLAEPGQVDTLVWAFPRSGKTLTLPVAQVVAEATGDDSVTPTQLRAELASAAGMI